MTESSAARKGRGQLPDAVAAHSADPDQRTEMARLGMWIFLGTEVLLFGVLFMAFTLYRTAYAEDFTAASGRLDVWLGAINTFVLLTSSLFAALAVASAERDKRRNTVWCLVATAVLAAVFLAIKAHEWNGEYRERLVPGFGFRLPDASVAETAHQQLFFCFYFIMTGIHALHMLIGAGVFGWLILRIHRRKGPFAQTERIRIESAALYWHFVDVVWIFLLPLLYLTGLN